MRFDKSTDEQCPKETWPRIKTRPDIILLEGWCVGATPDMVSPAPETDWEKTNDPQGIWKGWSLDTAQNYTPVWSACHCLIQLAQSDFEAVIDARWLQEKGNAAASGIWQFQNRAEVAAFCAHYESWTKALWRALPARADKLITRHADFTYAVTK
jgi:D-glycerate 3-kinase